MNGVRVLLAAVGEGLQHQRREAVHLRRIRRRRGRRAERVVRGRAPRDASEHQQVGQGVAAQPVGAVQPSRHLARGVESFHRGGGGIGVHPDATHDVVAGGSHLHGFLGDVHVRQLLELVVHGRQPPHDVLRVTAVGDVQVHAAVLGAAAGLDLGVDGPGHLVPGQQVGGAAVVLLVLVPGVGFGLVVRGFRLEELRDVVEHEAFALGVQQGAAIASHALGHQDAAHAGRPHHAGGVELDLLHVDEIGSHVHGHAHAVAAVLPRVGGHLPALARTAGGQHHGLAVEHDQLAAFAPVAYRAAHPAVVHEQVLDVALHVDVDAQRHRALLQRADHLQSGTVAHVGQSGVAVAAEVPLQDQALVGAVEQCAPFLQLQHPVGRLLGVELRHAPVVEQLAAAHGVAEVNLPVVLRPHVAHGGGDAALGHDGVRLAQQRLADDGCPGALVVGLDGGAQAGAAGSHHDHVVIVCFVALAGHQMNLRSWMTP